MRIVCAARNCKYSSDNEDTEHIMFINFPNSDMSKIWAHHCGRTDLLTKSNEELHLNYYICSHHIEDHYYISRGDPVIIDQHAIPTLFEPNIMDTEESLTNMFGTSQQMEVADHIVLPYCDINVEVNQLHNINTKFSSICRICGDTALDGIEIFAPKGIELKLKDKVNFHLPIDVAVGDLMPQKLCMNCYNNLEVAHTLAVTSLKTDMRLKKLLNINEVVNNDNRYNALIKMCSLEEEMCQRKAIEIMSTELASNKCEETCLSQESCSTHSHLENIHISRNNCRDNKKAEVQPDLNNFTESQNDKGKENECPNSIIKSYQINEATNHEIQCMHCKDTFKTYKMFGDHKVLCDKQNVVEQKQGDNNFSGIEPDKLREMTIEFVTRTCNICEAYFETDECFTKHKHTYCKLIPEKHCQKSDVLNKNKEECNIYDNSSNINNVPLVQASKKCGHCDLIYSTKKELLNHIMESHEGKLLFKCNMCDRNFEKWSSLDVHEATHRVDKPYLCDLCGKSFKHSNNLRGHKRTHLDESKKKRHVCEICRSAFRSRFHLGEHMNQHSGNKPYACEKCGKTFYKRIQLRQHKLSHGLNKHICSICGASFNRKGNMNTHIKRHNNIAGTYTCSVCGEGCKSMSDLKLHRKKHTEQDIIDSINTKCNGKGVSQCKVCDRIFSTRSALLNHEHLHKTDRIKIECDICGKKLASKNSLMYHKRSIHSSERPHMCQFCGDSFVSKEARLIHERIHTGERPHACTICKMVYKCSSNLSQHMKIHSGVKLYQCTYCNKSFTRKGSLNVHQRTHTGEKPFACETCGKRFSQKNDMTKHTKTHAAKSLRCEQCEQVFATEKDILKHIAFHKQNSPTIQEYVEVQQQVESCNIDMQSG